MSHTQSMQATFCHCLKFSFNVLKNILIGALFFLIKKTNRRSCNGFHIVRFICPSRACTQSPRSPAGSEACSTAPGSSPRGRGWRGTHCKIPVYPRSHWEYCSQVSRRSHTLNFKAKEVGKVSFLVSLSNEFIGTQFHHLNLSKLNDQNKRQVCSDVTPWACILHPRSFSLLRENNGACSHVVRCAPSHL